jgi:hypothetical protein
METSFYKPIIDEIATRVIEAVLAEINKAPSRIPPKLMKPEAAARYLDITKPALAQRRQAGTIPSDCWRKIGDSVMYVRDELDKWIDNLKE